MRRREFTLGGAALATTPFARAQVLTPGMAFDWPSIVLLDGRTLAPASWQGQAAVVVFWATWCAYCRRHNAHVDRLYRETPGQGLRVLGVALDRDADAVRQHVAARGYAFPVAADGDALRRRLTARRVTPMTFVFDRGGRLLQAIPGEMTVDDVLDLPRVAGRST